MKCIMRKDGKVERVSNSKAFRLVAQKAAVYCPKHEWKESRKTK